MRILRRGGQRREFSAAWFHAGAEKPPNRSSAAGRALCSKVCPAIQRGGRSQAGRGLLFIGQKSRIKDWQTLRQKGWGGLADERALLFGLILFHLFSLLCSLPIQRRSSKIRVAEFINFGEEEKLRRRAAPCLGFGRAFPLCL